MQDVVKRFAKALPKAAVVGALSFAAVNILVPSAATAGTSTKTNGCYAQWYSTYFKGVCESTTQRGYYQLNAYCDYEGDYHGDWYHKDRGYSGTFDDDSCTFRVTGGYVAYAGS
ncbi:hypothetical protein ACTMSW_21845 [Micromonospora sp. BQ11]|uniref:hypothetical protein n=1 Tax=Micromonospora sp. BQ11 TaxID=3452212 RepID=UPI003F886A2A